MGSLFLQGSRYQPDLPLAGFCKMHNLTQLVEPSQEDATKMWLCGYLDAPDVRATDPPSLSSIRVPAPGAGGSHDAGGGRAPV